MKKVFLVGLAVVILFSATNTNAMTERKLREKLTASYKINGEIVKATDAQVTEIDRYFRQYEISSKDAQYIADKIDVVIDYAKENKITKFSDANKKEKARLIEIVADINDNTSVNAKLGKDGVLTIYDKKGNVFTKITPVIKYTNNANIIAVFSVITVVGLAVITKKAVKADAK